jgi:hypothetical protein
VQQSPVPMHELVTGHTFWPLGHAQLPPGAEQTSPLTVHSPLLQQVPVAMHDPFAMHGT